ncbi:hypothetical protein [Rhodoferax antarcticus]|uniref:Uncharacterized protein n=1 Tax=Rhodoferax antarcticus ANT.BR TaxID=1111071 RepID=A0A1Q8Y9A4_9BURK|nr:hypothetical protein [Rhodoferax antarcticus]OLP04605.1 hypothetical protein BLL52_4103 [Rhodoferax antarcticus ANT.BR]
MDLLTAFDTVKSDQFFGLSELQNVRPMTEDPALVHAFRFDDMAIFKDGDGKDRWMLICPDMSNNQHWRTQSFDLDGFSGHMVFNTKDDALESVVRCGFYVRDDQALDRLHDLPSFLLGNYCCDLISKVNDREITYKQYLQLVSEYKVLHSLTDSLRLVV